jgi:hypothetical protein
VKSWAYRLVATINSWPVRIEKFFSSRDCDDYRCECR